MSASCKNLAPAATSQVGTGILRRSEFTISRLGEFGNREELTRLIGHSPQDWPKAALKELVDNSLDACEREGVAPVIKIAVDESSIVVSDNGSGIAQETVAGTLDFNFRTSSNAVYQSPTRGQQGNALQTLLAMPYAFSGKPGGAIIRSRGVRHRITFEIDPISREPRLDNQRSDIPTVPGTGVKLIWPEPFDEDVLLGLHDAVVDFSWINPHLTLSYSAPDGDFCSEATDPNWRKWTPTDPTSAHWYDVGSLKTLIAAEIDHARRNGSPQRTVADFIADFRGIKSTAKRRDICEAVNASHKTLEAFFAWGDGAIAHLLKEMKAASRPVKPRDLGVIGEEHVLHMVGGAPSAQCYKKVEVEVDGIPYFIESGFGFRPEGGHRQIIAALNWSASVSGNPFQRVRYQGLGSILTEQRASLHQPIAFFLHVATARPVFLDKGKSVVDLPSKVDDAIIAATRHVTGRWCAQAKAEERDRNAQLRRMDVMTAASKPTSVKDAAYSVMTEAYAAASDNGALPANARQIFYAARREIMRLAQKDTVDSRDFTQRLLIDYMNEHADECAYWDVVFSDRGHFTEPHTRRVVGLGTLAVRAYVAGYTKPWMIEGGFTGPQITTHGPEGRYGNLLYVEKEGFDPLMDQARIDARHDLAIMSCKGMSVTAARQLVDETCARYQIPLCTLHDLDISGFTIASTLHQSNRRYRFSTKSGEDFRVVDFGLRLDDVERLGLIQSAEPVTLRGSKAAWRERLKANGATDREIDFLLTGPRPDVGQRVELNALSSRQFIDFLEEKLAEHGVGKVIPDTDTLEKAYRLFECGASARKAVNEALAARSREETAVPADLKEWVLDYLAEHPAEAWDDAIQARVSRRADP